MSSNKKALLTGITGQDGSYLAELLLEKGMRYMSGEDASLHNTQRIDHLYEDPITGNPNLYLHYGDLTDTANIMSLISEIKPDEIYNLAAQSHVAVSFVQPEYTANIDGLGTLRVLEGIRANNLEGKTRLYQRGTSELYGLVQEIPQKKRPHFIQEVLMVLQNFMVTGLLKITEKLMEFMVVMEFF